MFGSISAFRPFTSTQPSGSGSLSGKKGVPLKQSGSFQHLKGVILLGQSWAQLCSGLSTLLPLPFHCCFLDGAHTQVGGVWNFPPVYPGVIVEIPFHSLDSPALPCL